MPYAILTVGLPGCGKTTWYNNHKNFLSGNITHLERDKIRHSFMEGKGIPFSWEVWDKDNEPIVTKIYNAQLKQAIQIKNNIILTDTWLNQVSRTEVISLLKENGYTIEVILMDTPLEMCKERNSKRGNYKVPDTAYNVLVPKLKWYKQIAKQDSATLGYKLTIQE